jgi:glucose-6-phosphate dehydrogenase assembly protein OpcA
VTAAAVSPDRILRELAELWVSLGKPPEGDPGAGVLRACSMTLLVMAEESDDVMSLGETIAALMPEHPARAIVIRLQGEGQQGLSARVFAQCWMPFGQRRQICCEQVEITAPDASLADLPPVVLPLCVPDLPVMLWCRSARLAVMPEFAQMAGMARRVILDSAALGAAREALPFCRAQVERGTWLGDLSWTRLTRWRETLSRTFENREFLGRLTELSRIQVCYGGPLAPPAAWYMGAWLLDSLAAAGLGATLQLQRDPNAPGGEVSSVHLMGSAASHPHVILTAKGEGLTVRVDGLSNFTVWPRLTEYLLLREELGIVRADPVFEKTLSSAARLALSSIVG